ncbi:MAG: hypothetical protein WAZ22_08080 [Mesotoga infera]
MSDLNDRGFKGFLSAMDVVEKADASFEGKGWRAIAETQSAAVVASKAPSIFSIFGKLFEQKFLFLYRGPRGEVLTYQSKKLTDLSQAVLDAALSQKDFNNDFLDLFLLFKEAPDMIEKTIAHYATQISQGGEDLFSALREMKILYEKVKKKFGQYAAKLPLNNLVTAIFKLHCAFLPSIEEDMVDFLKQFPPEPEGMESFVENQLLLAVGEPEESEIAVQLSRVETVIHELQKYCSSYLPWFIVPEGVFVSYLEKGMERIPSLEAWFEGVKDARTRYGLSQTHWEQSRRWYFEKIGAGLITLFQRSISGQSCWTIVEEKQIKDPLSHAGETVRYTAKRTDFKIVRDDDQEGSYTLCSIDEMNITSSGLKKATKTFPYENVNFNFNELKISKEAFLDSKDARFAGYTWKYLLPGGGQDREAKNNERVECFVYYVITVLSKGFGTPILKLFFAKEENAKLFLDFMNEATILGSWKEYPQNGLPAPLKAKQRTRESDQRKAGSQDPNISLVPAIERLPEILATIEEPKVVEDKKPFTLPRELVEKINSLHYELEWSVKSNLKTVLHYYFPEMAPEEIGAIVEEKLPVAGEKTYGLKELEDKIEALSGKTLQTVCKILACEPEKEYTLEELGLSFWSVFVVAPKITTGGKPLIEVISGEKPRVIWGRNFDSRIRDILKRKFTFEG